MKRRHERGALAAGRNVAAAEVGDDVDAAQLGEQRGRVQLDRVAAVVERSGPMAHRLAVGRDGAYRAALDAARDEQRRDDLRIEPRQRIGGARAARQFVVAASVECQQLAAQRRVERAVFMSDDAQRKAIGIGGAQVDEYTVDAVERGARHQADVER